MTLSCLLLEDQAPARRLLEDYAARHPDLNLIGSTALASLAFEMLETEAVDLLFLDLSLPQTDGFQFLKSQTSPPVTIITTAFPNRAVEGFEVGVADYLVKPIPYGRFCIAIDRAKTVIETGKSKETIRIPTGRNDYQTVRLSDIQCLSADGDYVSIYTDGGHFHVAGPLSDWQVKLPQSRFARVHRSHIVNLDRIDQRSGNTLIIGGIDIPVGPTYVKLLGL